VLTHTSLSTCWYDCCRSIPVSFLFSDSATTELYTLSLHDALPICAGVDRDLDSLSVQGPAIRCRPRPDAGRRHGHQSDDDCRQRDRKSTRLNSSHVKISYAVFCLKKKKKVRTVLATYTTRTPLLHS